MKGLSVDINVSLFNWKIPFFSFYVSFTILSFLLSELEQE